MRSKLKYGITLFLVLATLVSRNQDARSLIDTASVMFDFEKVDSSKMLFEEAFNVTNDKSIQLEALNGLLKIAVFLVKLDEADSIYNVGELMLAESSNIDKAIEIRFNQSYAELLRKQAKYDEALTIHKNMLAKSKQLPDGEKIMASSYLFISATFDALYEPDSALKYIEKAYEISSSIYPENHVKMTSLYNMMGSCYYRLSDFDNATLYYKKAIANVSDNVDGASYLLPMAYGNLATVETNKGNYEIANGYVEHALAINKSLKEPEGTGYNYYSLAVNYYYLGDYGRAADYANACINIRKNLYAANHIRLAGPTELLGIIYEESGDFESAIAFLKKAKTIKIQNLGPESVEVAYSNENIALCNLRLDIIDSANHYINLANAIIPLKTPANSYDLATHYFSLSNIKLRNKDYPAALSAIGKSTSILEAIGLDDSEDYALNLAFNASIYSEQHEFEKAQQLYDKAISTIQLDKDSILQNVPFVINDIKLSIVNLLIDHSFKAYQATKDDFYLKQTQVYSKVFLVISDNYRKQFNDPYTKSAIAQKNSEGIQIGFSINYQFYQNQPSNAALEEAFKYAEIGRTALFRDLIDDYKIKSFAGISSELIQQEEKYKTEIAELSQKMLETPNDAELKHQLFTTKEAFNQHIANYSKTNNQYYNLKYKNDDVTIEMLQKEVLKNGENFIEYVADDTAYYAILIQKENSFIEYLGSKVEINTKVEEWRKSITTINFKKTSVASTQLYNLLIKPIEANILDNRLIIVPTHSLFYLNFESLKKNIDDSKYLIHDYNIRYGLSANVLYEQLQTKSKVTGVPIVIAPGFEEDVKSKYEASVKDKLDIDQDYLNTVRQPWSLKLANYMSKKYRGKALTGEVASETNVILNLNNSPIVHFATHAIADEKDPLRSKLVLAKDIDSSKNDGYLHTYEIYNLNLQTELAILTACESGIGNIQKGEGMISLAYSMNYAGCPSVIMSLWKIDEKTNSEITTNFYKYLSKGQDISTSLRSAKLDYLAKAKGTLSHPFYWSGLVMMGKNSTIELQSNFMNWKIVLPIILLFIGLVILARKMKSKN